MMILWKGRKLVQVLPLVAASLVTNVARASMNTDPRLDQKIQIRAQGEPLEAILAGVKEVKLQAASPMADSFLVCRYTGTVHGLMQATARFFAADRNHIPRWVRWGSPGHYRYQLDRERECAQYVADLRARREKEYISRVERILRAPEAWPHRPFLRAFARLSIADQKSLLDGVQITHSVPQLAGKESPVDFLRSLGAPRDRSIWDGGLLSMALVRTGPELASFCTIRSGDPARPNQSMRSLTPLSVFYPEAAPQQAAQAWIRAYGDPAPKAAEPRFTWAFPKAGQVPARIIFYRLAECSHVNLIADDEGFAISRQFLPVNGSISEALDQLCHGGPLVMPTEVRGSWFWRQFRGTYLIRSIYWPEEETQAPPYRWVRQWQENEQRHGLLGMDDILEIAALSPRQVRQLTAVFPQIESLPRVQPLLRWYLRASPRLRASILTPKGVPLSELGITYEKALQDLEPGETPPPYFAEILRVPADRLHLSILWGKSGPSKDLAKPALGVFVTEYQNSKPAHSPSAMAVPLMR